MGENINNDEYQSQVETEDIISPQKRLRLDLPGRKSWSLMDRRPDNEVLQEMGVSLLEPEDGDLCPISGSLIHKSSATKRKHDIENVNPNILECGSPLKSPRVRIFSPSPGTSRGKSPRSVEKCKPLQPTEQNILETTLSEEYLVEEETPIGQFVSAQHKPAAGERSRGYSTPLTQEEALNTSRLHKCEPQGDDAFDSLSDEVILSVFRWLPKRTLAHCMQVCKRWNRVACDETLWQRLDLGNKTLTRNALGKILSRKPIMVRFASAELSEWHPTTTEPCRLQYLDLSMCATDSVTLRCLLAASPALKKLSLESLCVDDTACTYIGKCSSLETLNLAMAQGLTAKGLGAILQGCTHLQSLNISWCSLSEDALRTAVTSLPVKIQRVNLAGARIMTDDLVSQLVSRCPRLVELDLSDCGQLCSRSVTSLLSLHRLEHLGLSRCYLLPPHVLTKLNSMSSLQYLEVWGMLPTASLSALRAALPAIQVNQFMFSAIARPTVGARRTSIWGLRTRD